MSKRVVLVVLAVFAFSAGQQCLPDADRDGVIDDDDMCPNTPICGWVDEAGCPSDDDNDGVVNGCDECPDTAVGDTVYGNGCSTTGAGVPPRRIGPDPRAKVIEYSLVNRTGDTTGDILIKGVVENYGLEDYVSDPGLQALQLWEDDNMVQTVSFQNLAVDETVIIEYQRAWDTASESPVARYKLIVTYAPDIRQDGNPDNDDFNLSNNSILRSAADIDSLLE